MCDAQYGLEGPVSLLCDPKCDVYSDDRTVERALTTFIPDGESSRSQFSWVKGIMRSFAPQFDCHQPRDNYQWFRTGVSSILYPHAALNMVFPQGHLLHLARVMLQGSLIIQMKLVLKATSQEVKIISFMLNGSLLSLAIFSVKLFRIFCLVE